MSAICITAGEQSENHVGMQVNGKGLSSKGFSVEEIIRFKQVLDEKGIKSEFYRLDEKIEDADEAALLIIRNGVDKIAGISSSDMKKEQMNFDWDKKFQWTITDLYYWTTIIVISYLTVFVFSKK